ncbi:DNA-binding protein [Kitasatospora xanthocidica]|uniref:DNA-binding protein n=2 Tax=Kitasatospora xanthocidica TaxID=83382 RepID=A0A372ZVF3_9ACTN|nr:DNA-binding protein [Kitasatospora xanthocidica]
MLQTLEHIGLALARHAEIRSGIKRSPAPSTSNLARAGLPGADHYYRLSDLLPAHIGIQQAAEVLGITETTALRMVRDASFPCPVTRMGRSYRVPVKAFMASLGIPDSLLHPDDVENGAEHAAGVAAGINIAEVPQGLDCPDF